MSNPSLAERLQKEGAGALEKDDQDLKHAKSIVKAPDKKGAVSENKATAPIPVTTPPPKAAKPDQEYLGGYIDSRVVDAILTDVSASRGRWNKTKLLEFILAKHYDLDLSK